VKKIGQWRDEFGKPNAQRGVRMLADAKVRSVTSRKVVEVRGIQVVRGWL